MCFECRQTNDIWFDSPENGFDTYSQPIEMPTGNAKKNGDRPRVDEGNRYHAHVWNDGIVDAADLGILLAFWGDPASLG